MKKNKMMRIASAVAMATLLSTCVISGTFAKYTTSGEATDTARVAKWGVKVEAAASQELFVKEYTGTEDAVTVSATTDVVAPGTNGEFSKFIVEGTPEVKVSVTYDAEVTLSDNWSDGTNFYCPIVITVAGEKVDTSAAQSAADYASAVVAAIEAVSKDFDIGTAITSDLTIAWAWDFDDEGKGTNDVKDTYLGNLETAPIITVKVTATVTQID